MSRRLGAAVAILAFGILGVFSHAPSAGAQSGSCPPGRYEQWSTPAQTVVVARNIRYIFEGITGNKWDDLPFAIRSNAPALNKYYYLSRLKEEYEMYGVKTYNIVAWDKTVCPGQSVKFNCKVEIHEWTDSQSLRCIINVFGGP